MKNRIFALIVALVGTMLTATAENYGLTVGGVDVTDKNCQNITGENIKALDESKAFSAVYNPTTKTLTLKNVNISREGSNRRAVQNDKVEGLTIVLDGENYLYSRDASAVRLNKSATITTTAYTEDQKFNEIYSRDQEAIYITNGSTLTISEAILYVHTNKKSTIGGDSGKESVGIKNSGVLLVGWGTVEDANHSVENVASLKVENSALRVYGYGSVFNKVKSFSTEGNIAVIQEEGKHIYYSSSQQTMASTDGTVVRLMTIAPVLRINEANFPDKAFREYLYTQDYGKDSVLVIDNPLAISRKSYNTVFVVSTVANETLTATNIDVSNKGITSLKGIEYFTELNTLHCESNALTTLDLSAQKELKLLHCYYNRLTTLDLSAQKNLRAAYLNNNKLTKLTLPQTATLQTLQCDENQLTALDASGCTGLTTLSCNDNQIGELDLDKCLDLTYLACQDNKLTKLLLPAGNALETVYCQNNLLTELDCYNTRKIATLLCYDNKLKTLRLPHNGALTILDCHDNALTELDVRENTALTTLNCSNNQLSELDLSKNAKLTKLECFCNRLSALDLTFQREITAIECYGNRINGEATTELFNSIAATATARTIKFVDHSNYNEQNECTAEQIALANKRGWSIIHNNGGWYHVSSGCKNYDLWLGGNHINSHNTAQQDKYLYRPESQTLSLYGDITGTGTDKDAATAYGAALYSKVDGLNILVSNDATLSGADECLGLYLCGKTTIEGAAKLTAKGYSGIYLAVSDTLTIGGTVEVEAEGKYHGISGRARFAARQMNYFSTLEIKDKATVRAKGGYGTIADWKEINLADGLAIAAPEGAEIIDGHDIGIDGKVVSGDTWVEIREADEVVKRGDVDMNGEINTADVVAIYNYIIGGEESGIDKGRADVDEDGEVNTSDVVGVYNIIINGE